MAPGKRREGPPPLPRYSPVMLQVMRGALGRVVDDLVSSLGTFSSGAEGAGGGSAPQPFSAEWVHSQLLLPLLRMACRCAAQLVPQQLCL